MRFGVPMPAVLAGCLLLGGAGLVGGCAENRSSLFIGGMLYRDPTSSDCTAEITGEVQLISRGYLDVALIENIDEAYYGGLLWIGNQLVTQGNSNLLRTETSRIQIEGADITVTPIVDGDGGGTYRMPVSGFVNPDDTDAGFASIGITLVPPGVIQGTGEYVIEVTLFGRTLGGTRIESGAWTFPLTVCNGCLARCPSDIAEIEQATCAELGHDYPVDCRFYDKPSELTDLSGPVCARACGG